jgi:hypothetical protein
MSVAALPAALLFATSALAADAAAPLATAMSSDAPWGLAAGAPAPHAQFAGLTTFESIRYRPRRWRDRDRDRDRVVRTSGSSSSGFAQIHGGFFDPDGDPGSAFLGGARIGGTVNEAIQLGVGIDWSHRSDRTTVVVTDVPLPGGGTAERQTVLSRSSSNLVPVMAILQISPGADLPFAPYFGIGGGYETLFLSAEDFETGEDFEATYGGWGWQAWGGASIELSGNSRFTGEVFWNSAELERDIDDTPGGATLREIVPQDGVGMRLGLSWGF